METRQLAEQIQIQIQTYRPHAVRRVHIPKPGRPNETRPLGIPTVRDRVVQRAIVNVIEPILDHQFHERSFCFRHGRGAHDALRLITDWVEQAGLPLHPTKTKIVDSRVESFAFPGYSFREDKIYPRRESLAKMKARVKELTPRKRPGWIQQIAAELTSVLRGWFGYFRHCRWTIFKDLDGKIRSRLRRLLLRRHKNNPQRLPRTQRWPNDYFAKAGLYSLRKAHFRFDQSVAGNY